MIRIPPWRQCLILTFSLLIGFSAGIGIKFVWENTAFQPYSWVSDQGPIILNCYGDEFSEVQMLRAVDFWVLRGHKFGFYEHNPPDEVCDIPNLEGMIILRKGNPYKMKDNVLAYTTRRTSFGQMVSATITYRPGSQNLMYINEHELGHALGYAHHDEVGHIMHSLYDKMSGSFWVP